MDLAGFTALAAAHGDEAAADVSEWLVTAAASALNEGDELVKSIGDAVLLASVSPTAGLELVRRVCSALGDSPGVPLVRIGSHHGSAVVRGADFFGSGVNVAARVAAQAASGQVLGTQKVAAAATEVGLPVVALGDFELRNVPTPVAIFEIGGLTGGHGATVDPVCRMAVERDHAAGRLRHAGTEYWFCSLRCAAAFAAEPDAYTYTGRR